MRTIQDYLHVFPQREDIEVTRHEVVHPSGPGGLACYEEGVTEVGAPIFEYDFTTEGPQGAVLGYIRSPSWEPFPWEWNPYESRGIEVEELAFFDNSINEVQISHARLAGVEEPKVIIEWGDDSVAIFDDLAEYYRAGASHGFAWYWFSERDSRAAREHLTAHSRTFDSRDEAVEAIEQAGAEAWGEQAHARAEALADWLGQDVGILFYEE